MSIARLKRDTLSQLAPSVARPPLADRDFGAGILHLGIGAFHRAHQAVYTQAALAARPGDWGIVGVSLRSPATRDTLAAQDNLYSVITLGDSGQNAEVVAVIKDVLYAPEDPQAVIAAIADPRIRVVSLTVTEKGYHHDPASGALRRDDPEIVADLAQPQAPRSALGFLLRGLQHRRDGGGGPITLLSCDNLPENGRFLARLLRQVCAEAAPDLLSWLEEHVACPCSMVDGIVPAVGPESLRQAEAVLGLRDEAAVLCEPFRQWVIEDDFAAGRPAWEAAGAELVGDVRPYETMKLRLLNGTHSALAYLGYLGGYATIAETMADPSYEAFARRLMLEEAGPAITLPPGYGLADYAETLVARFRNPALAHRTWQIAMDGSRKLPQRLLASLYSQLPRGRPMPCSLLAVAAWILYVGASDEAGDAIDVRDPLAARLAALHANAHGDAKRLVSGFLALEEVFGPSTRQPPMFGELLAENLVTLRQKGARAAVGRLVS